ncbi:hypothetical protein RA210_U10521 [Rubrivivax sp. A210]|nr:hypothetical protein RA210_U10521 [Rubrivivax sp. A210]
MRPTTGRRRTGRRECAWWTPCGRLLDDESMEATAATAASTPAPKVHGRRPGWVPFLSPHEPAFAFGGRLAPSDGPGPLSSVCQADCHGLATGIICLLAASLPFEVSSLIAASCRSK